MFLNLFFTFIASLFAYDCPESIDTQSESYATHQWLEKWKDTQSLGNCEVEIITCQHSKVYNNSAPIAEVLILTPDKREAYISIDFPLIKSRRLNTEVKINKRALFYQKKDRYYEPQNGRTEVWRFEMRTSWSNTDELEVMDLGVYSTNNQLNQYNGNDSHWYNCSIEK